MVESATKPTEQFTVEAARAGSIVYQARSPEEVSNYILVLARKHNMKRLVKSKSFLADRIKLRQVLQNQGLDVTETDIAEWIAQLSGENTTASPKSVEQIAEILSKNSVSELKSDADSLLEVARATLRKICIGADIGISNAEVAVAETGTCILTSNEGNDRLVSLLPRLHITLIDRQSIVATWEEAIAKLKGMFNDNQVWRMPSFVTYLTGRNTTGDIPGAMRARAQGPEEEHIVIVDIS